MNLSDYYSAGYMVVLPCDRPDYMWPEMPNRIISVSTCICSHAPDDWCIQWVNVEDSARQEFALEFGIVPPHVGEVIDWITALIQKREGGYPDVIYSLSTAREFQQRFVNAPQAILLGLGLHKYHVDSFIEEEKPAPNDGVPGILEALTRRSPLEQGQPLGFEILGYDGGFHSWLCNSLEKKVAREFGTKPNEHGFISTQREASIAAHYCGREEVGAEPGRWLEWLIVRYS